MPFCKHAGTVVLQAVSLAVSDDAFELKGTVQECFAAAVKASDACGSTQQTEVYNNHRGEPIEKCKVFFMKLPFSKEKTLVVPDAVESIAWCRMDQSSWTGACVTFCFKCQGSQEYLCLHR